MIPSSKLGWLGSIYAQDEWRLTDQLTLNGGLRFDQMDAYVSTNQLSPRISLTYKPFVGTTFHAGYARYFTPPEQALAAPTNLALYANTTAAPARERNRARCGRSVRIISMRASIRSCCPASSAASMPIISARPICSTMGNSAQALVLTAFNYAKAYNTGVELKADYQMGDFSAYANFAWARQRATQVSSNQYLFGQDEIAYISDHYIYTDHAQTLTASAGASYLWQATKFSADLIYGSGLRNGFANTGTVSPTRRSISASRMNSGCPAILAWDRWNCASMSSTFSTMSTRSGMARASAFSRLNMGPGGDSSARSRKNSDRSDGSDYRVRVQF